jgi:hypothetical protein
MKRRKKTQREAQTIPVWTYSQARQAFPYLASIMRTIRESRIESQTHQITLRRQAAFPGRPDRRALIDQHESLCEARLAENRFEEAIQELNDLGIACLDPIRGVALIPFAQNDQLAWFVYDLFDSEPVRFWRFHDDPIDERRPIAKIGE